MNDTLLKLYHRLPYPARSLAATARGLYLRTWRYGPETDQLAAEALERENWSSAQWAVYQEERLAYVLHRAATRVPYYREQWARRRRKGDRRSWQYLENWPVLEKDDLRATPEAFVADDCNIRQMFPEHTSGTTSKPLSLWWSHKTVRQWYALFEARWRQWYGVSRHDRWAILGGQLVTPVEQRRPPFWVWNAAMNQLYMSSYHLAPDLIPAYLDALLKHRIVYLWGYTSALYELARVALRDQRDDLRMKVVITNAEPVFDYQREVIEQAFQCQLRETYGMAEIVAAAGDCETGQLHLWPEVGVLEVLDGSTPLPPGASGDLVCTGLINDDMPLLRYRVGDRGAVSGEASCACHRCMPTLAALDGRSDDILYTADGRSVGRLGPVFQGELPIYEAQIIQESLSTVRILVVPTHDYTPADGASIVMRLRERMGEVTVLLEEVTRIPRTRNGKFRRIVNRLSNEELRAVTSREQ